MNIKFLNIVFASFVLFSSSMANAGILNVNDIVSDASGVEWFYIGEYDMASGPSYLDGNGDGTTGDAAKIYSGITAAEAIFGELSFSDLYAISTVEDVVEHEAWYDRIHNSYVQLDESLIIDNNLDGFYNGSDGTLDTRGDASAWVQDRALPGSGSENKINYVFSSSAVSVPEPSSLAIFSLALLAFGRRYFKK
ncbi:PEP-CTERM sorting domain-containing protein [Pseudocolwellia sp. HL-MZ19]|uniref:PEP-CTERM sorting domain-containing protein n=1 Tax=unclassified Pseudocolwellia TaxID=2848178 RepID=UPI003CEFD000